MSWIRYPKKTSEFLVEPQIFLFKDEHPGSNYMTSFESLQRPKGSSNIAVPLQNMANDVPYTICELQ